MKNYKKLFLFTTCLLVGFLVMTCKSSDSQEIEKPAKDLGEGANC